MNFISTNPTLIVLIALLAFFGFTLSIYGISSLLMSQSRMSTRLDYFIGSEESTNLEFNPESNIVPREIEGSLFKRTIMRWFRGILRFLGRFTPDTMVKEIEHKLIVAGNPGNLGAREFYAIRFLVLLGGIGFGFWVNRDFQNLDTMNIIMGLGSIAVGLMFPNYWLKSKMRARQDVIRQNLPDALDMLSVCASAGLGFDQSLQKISAYWETELGAELRRTTQEMEMGVSRTVALRNLSHRLEVDDLSRFVALIVQAEKVGMSYADVLHSQAIQMRVQRQYRAREMANKLPGKMILPIALFIFPAMLAVILGPSIPLVLNIF